MKNNKNSIEENIREFINNNNRVLHCLIKNKEFWNQYLSSLDTIGDCELAIKDYVDNHSNGEGEKYLRLYGLLQALFVQQDAVKNLIEALSETEELPIEDHVQEDLKKIHEEIKLNADLIDIRDIRNSSIGHPTKRTDQSYHFIVRISINKHGFQLHSYYPPDYKLNVRNISVVNLINRQKQFLSEKLDQVLRIFEEEDRKHRYKFKTEKLDEIFNGLCKYGQYGQISIESILEDIESIDKMLGNFKKALDDRGIELDAYVGIKEIYAHLEHPMRELKYFKSNLDREIGDKAHIDDSRMVNIFFYFIVEKMRELKECAKEIDREYLEIEEKKEIVQETIQSFKFLEKLAGFGYGEERDKFEKELEMRTQKGEIISGDIIVEIIDKIKNDKNNNK